MRHHLLARSQEYVANIRESNNRAAYQWRAERNTDFQKWSRFSELKLIHAGACGRAQHAELRGQEGKQLLLFPFPQHIACPISPLKRNLPLPRNKILKLKCTDKIILTQKRAVNKRYRVSRKNKTKTTTNVSQATHPRSDYPASHTYLRLDKNILCVYSLFLTLRANRLCYGVPSLYY